MKSHSLRCLLVYQNTAFGQINYIAELKYLPGAIHSAFWHFLNKKEVKTF